MKKHVYLPEAYPGEFDDWHPETDPDQCFSHTGWLHTRKLVDAAFGRTNVPRKRRLNFRGCGSNAWVYCTDTSPPDYRLRASWCHDRFCLVCGAARAAHIAGVVKDRLADDRPLFITLTIANTHDGLRPALDRLYAGFRQLRHTDDWKQRIKGGAAFLEVKYSHKADRWHPHLHIIAQGKYWPQAELSALWKAITKDSFIVDVQRVKQQAEALSYVTKYASKPMSLTFLATEHLADEALTALRGRRLITTFGNWRGMRLSDHGPTPQDEADVLLYFRPVAPLQDICRRAAAGEAQAGYILTTLGRWKDRVKPSTRPPPGLGT